MSGIRSRWALLVGAWGLTTGLPACTEPPTPQPATQPASAPAEAAPTEATPAGPEAPPPLSEEDLALIAADPATLTPEMRRKRAYARRRQIMQNPDSPTARALQDLAEAHQAGDLDVQPKGGGSGLWFHTRGAKPTEGRPPAGWRPSDATPMAEDPSDAEAPAPNDTAVPADPATPVADVGAEPTP